MFKKRIAERLETLTVGRSTMGIIDLIKMFIRCECIPDHTGYMICIIAMLNTFATTDHHQYAKEEIIYVLLMQKRQNILVCQETTLTKFTVYINHAVRLSDHELSGNGPISL